MYNLLYGIGDNNVDNAAHTGGLVAGFLLGVVCGVADKVREKGKRMVVACLAEFVLLSELVCWFSALTHGMPPDYQECAKLGRVGSWKPMWKTEKRVFIQKRMVWGRIGSIP